MMMTQLILTKMSTWKKTCNFCICQIMISLKKLAHIIKFVNYSIKCEPENCCREWLMLYLLWQNEEIDLNGGFETYKRHYAANKEH